MLAEDLNGMKNDGPDDDFIIKSGSGQDVADRVEQRLEAAGIEVPVADIPKAEAEVVLNEDMYVEEDPIDVEPEKVDPVDSPSASVEPLDEIYIPDESEPDIDESEEELFAQIDEFRQKASRITALIREKQHRMDQLEEQLHEKEVENLRDQQKLLAMKKEVAGRSASISREAVAEAAVRAANEAVAKSDDKMNETLKSVEDKMSSMEQTLSEGADIGGIKGDIFDKIHDENVRVYRNIQDFMKERDENDTRFEDIQKVIKTTRRDASLAVVLGLANLLLLIFVLMTVIGIV